VVWVDIPRCDVKTAMVLSRTFGFHDIARPWPWGRSVPGSRPLRRMASARPLWTGGSPRQSLVYAGEDFLHARFRGAVECAAGKEFSATRLLW